jgi:hypothetical protein
VLKDKKTIFIDKKTKVGKNVIIYENNRIEGASVIEDNVTIFPNCFISNSSIGKGSKIYSAIIDKSKIGRKINGVEIYHIDQFRGMSAECDVAIGIITVPVECAQGIADLMVAWGIKAIWNFTPARIKVPAHVAVQNTTIYTNLAILFNNLQG